MKRQRVSGDLALDDIQVSGRKWDVNGNGMFGVDVINKGYATPYERTFGDDEIDQTTDKELKALRERMSGLELWDAWEPNRGSSLFQCFLPTNVLQVSRLLQSAFTACRSTLLLQKLSCLLVIN